MSETLRARVSRIIAGGFHAALDKIEDQAPEAMMEQSIREVEQVIAELNTREFPKVMKESAARLRGRADGKLVNEVVKELTS